MVISEATEVEREEAAYFQVSPFFQFGDSVSLIAAVLISADLTLQKRV